MIKQYNFTSRRVVAWLVYAFRFLKLNIRSLYSLFLALLMFVVRSLYFLEHLGFFSNEFSSLKISLFEILTMVRSKVPTKESIKGTLVWVRHKISQRILTIILEQFQVWFLPPIAH